jgi:galactokinase
MQAKKIFKSKFGKVCQKRYLSPGRVNIIGEHSDYHDGYVMPAAIDLGISWAVRKNDTGDVRGYSEKLDDVGKFSLSSHAKAEHEWMRYLQCAVWALEKRGRLSEISGVDFAIHSTIPIGSGLSSSSSLATGFAFILNDLYSLGYDGVEIAKIACEAEWLYGTTGGIMDQFCIANAKAGYAVLLDSRSLDYELVEIPKEIEIVIFETTIRHKQIDSPFDLRRRQAQKILDIAREQFPDRVITKLRDLTVADLDHLKGEVLARFGEQEGKMLLRRSLHPVAENKRVLQMKKAFASKNFDKVGKILYECHKSLRDNYEVSCEEMDEVIAIARASKLIIGARMVGGGFGGCSVNLVRRGDAEVVARYLETEFAKKTGIKGRPYICTSSDAVKEIV